MVIHTPADYKVLPGHGFHTIDLMGKVFRTYENCVACDTVQETIGGIEARLGAEEAGRLKFAAKPWDVARVPAFRTSVPVPVMRLLKWDFERSTER